MSYSVKPFFPSCDEIRTLLQNLPAKFSYGPLIRGKYSVILKSTYKHSVVQDYHEFLIIFLWFLDEYHFNNWYHEVEPIYELFRPQDCDRLVVSFVVFQVFVFRQVGIQEIIVGVCNDFHPSRAIKPFCLYRANFFSTGSMSISSKCLYLNFFYSLI